jgi:hypothetical protein
MHDDRSLIPSRVGGNSRPGPAVVASKLRQFDVEAASGRSAVTKLPEIVAGAGSLGGAKFTRKRLGRRRRRRSVARRFFLEIRVGYELIYDCPQRRR